jgi:hypothetical protein
MPSQFSIEYCFPLSVLRPNGWPGCVLPNREAAPINLGPWTFAVQLTPSTTFNQEEKLQQPLSSSTNGGDHST